MERIELTTDEIHQLKGWASEKSANPRRALRAHVILECYSGKNIQEISKTNNINRITVSKTKHRFQLHGLRGIEDSAPRLGRKTSLDLQTISEILYYISNNMPSKGLYWTTRSIADECGISINKAYKVLQRYRNTVFIRNIARENDIALFNTLVGIGGLFIFSQIKVIAFYIDKNNDPCCRTKVPSHHYTKRELEIARRKYDKLADMIEMYHTTHKMNKHRYTELLIFLRNIEREASKVKNMNVFIVMNSNALDVKGRVMRWLEKNPRFQIVILSSDNLWPEIEYFFNYYNSDKKNTKVLDQVFQLLSIMDSKSNNIQGYKEPIAKVFTL